MFNLVIEEFLTACLCDTATECKDTNFLKHVGKIFCAYSEMQQNLIFDLKD